MYLFLNYGDIAFPGDLCWTLRSFKDALRHILKTSYEGDFSVTTSHIPRDL